VLLHTILTLGAAEHLSRAALGAFALGSGFNFVSPFIEEGVSTTGAEFSRTSRDAVHVRFLVAIGVSRLNMR